jgi:hypothetical protein
MRIEIVELANLGQLPSSSSQVERIMNWQAILEAIVPPVSNDEAAVLAELLPSTEDDCFGLAWSLVHLIESSPGWPIPSCLDRHGHPWIEILKLRLRNVGSSSGAG